MSKVTNIKDAQRRRHAQGERIANKIMDKHQADKLILLAPVTHAETLLSVQEKITQFDWKKDHE